MKDHLIQVACDTDTGIYNDLRWAFTGARDHAHPIEHIVDPDDRSFHKRVTCWLVEEADVAVVVDFMTRHFPGRDIQVFKMFSIHTRPAGELQSKTVTKDGVLPA